MPYDAFEVTPGACIEQVEMLCMHLTDGGSFGGNAVIQQTDVESFISATYYEMVAMMAEFFISSAQTDSKILGLLQYFNSIGAASKIELVSPTLGSGVTSNTRQAFLTDQYENGFVRILGSNALSVMGAIPLTDPRGEGLTAGGISKADKDIIDTDSDANTYSFRRKDFDNPFVEITPSGDSVKELP